MKEMEQIKQVLTQKLEKLNQLKGKIEKSLKKAPEGTLILSSSNGSVQYYHKTKSEQKKGKYIEKKNQKLIAALAQKDYDLRFYKEVEKQKRQISKILKYLPDTELTEIFATLPAQRKEFVKSHVLSDEQYVAKWLNVEFTGKEFPGDFPLHITERGESVRSKTEKILADKLFAMGIPYRYEYPLKLKGFGVVYPDFTILKISTREEIYLEHFGIMDNPQYCQKAILKLQEYARNNIYPGKNLLITFETSQIPLDMNIVEQMLTEFILK